MGRSFDGTDDDVNFGSDASVDNFLTTSPNTFSASFWMKRGATGFVCLFNKRTESVEEGWQIAIRGAGAGHLLRLQVGTLLTTGLFDSTNGLSSTTALSHIAIAYDATLLSNVPTMYINGVAETVVVGTTPTGTIDADAGFDLKLAESHDNALNFNGTLGWVCYDTTIFSAAEANRAKYWGRPKGGLKVYHPLVSDKLGNEGSATAAGTATGATVVSFVPPVVRPGAAMMGLGVGW